MKTIVLYKSKSGYTKTYAEWISEALGCEMMESSGVNPETLLEYDTIIYGGGLYAAGINGIELITGNIDDLKGKNLVVWATGSCRGTPEEQEDIWSRNFTPEQRAVIKGYYLRGGFDYTKLNKVDKVLMSLLRAKLLLTPNRSEDQTGLLNAYKVPEYHCKRENIDELVAHVRGLEAISSQTGS